MRPRVLLIAGTVVVGLAALAVVTFSAPTEPGWTSQIWYRAEYRASSDLIERVEDFRRREGRLPASLGDLGVLESEECPCYRRISTADYRVWFGTVLGESLTYDSGAQAWR